MSHPLPHTPHGSATHPRRLRRLSSLLGLLSLSGLACLSTPALAAPLYTQVDLGKSQVQFVSRQMGVPITGKFARFAAQLRFDPAQPAQASARLDINLASIDAGSAEANEEVVGKSWFNVRQHPQASFVSTALRANGPGRYELHGTLTIKGHSKALVTPLSVKEQGGTAHFEGAFTLLRSDFALGEGVWADSSVVANEVEIRFRIAAQAGK